MMNPRVETFGGLTCRVQGGRDGRGGGDGGVVVLLHGFGAPGADLVPLGSAMRAPAGTRFVFPEAPLALPWGYDSRAWWMIDIEKLERALQEGRPRDMADEVPPGLPPARESMLALLEDVRAELGAPASRVVLGGFSQGSMLALDVALRMPSPPAGLVLWSTTLLTEREWTPLLPGRAGLPVFMSHGTQDPLLPFFAAEELKDLLVAAGWRVTWRPFRGPHAIPEEAIEGAGDLVREALG